MELRSVWMQTRVYGISYQTHSFHLYLIIRINSEAVKNADTKASALEMLIFQVSVSVRRPLLVVFTVKQL